MNRIMAYVREFLAPHGPAEIRDDYACLTAVQLQKQARLLFGALLLTSGQPMDLAVAVSLLLAAVFQLHKIVQHQAVVVRLLELQRQSHELALAHARIANEADWRRPFNRADAALYAAKADGRNRIVGATSASAEVGALLAPAA